MRFFLLSGHYRSQLNYSEAHLEQAHAGLERLYTALRGIEPTTPSAVVRELYEERFRTALNDDFNVPEAHVTVV